MMALIKNINSYVDLSDADSYIEGRIHSEDWISANESQKEKALITAARMLDSLSWIGEIKDKEQDLAFPRIGTYFDPLVGDHVTLEDDVPGRIKNAQIELAQHILVNDVVNSAGTLTDLKVDVIELKGLGSQPQIPLSVRQFVTPLLESIRSGRMWWRAN